MDQFHLLLSPLPIDNREILLRVLGIQYCAALSNNYTPYFGYLMGTLDAARQHALLNIWLGNNLASRFSSIDHLYGYLLPQSPANQLAFIRACPQSVLSGLIKTSNDLLKFFFIIPIENYKNLFEAMGSLLIHSILSDYYSMQTFISQMP